MAKPNYDAAIKEIAAVHATKPRKTHPVWLALINGELNRNQVIIFIRQFGAVPLYNHNYHGPLYINCPNAKWRMRMAEVVYEEGTGRLYADGVPHFQLYLNVGEALGITAEEMYGTEYCAGALAWRGWMSDICRQDFVSGFAALSLGSEAQVPGVSGRVSEAMTKYYGLTPQQAAFFTVHEVADSDHSGGDREFLETFCPTERDVRRAVEAVRGAVEISWLLYEGIQDLVRDNA